MPAKLLKNHIEHGADFDVRWETGWCTVGFTSYFRTRNIWPDREAGEDDLVGFAGHPEFSAEDLDILIATLQQARQEAYGRPVADSG